MNAQKFFSRLLRNKRLLLTPFLFLFASSPSWATTYYVDNFTEAAATASDCNNNTDAACTSGGNDCSIRDAIAKAVSGDTIAFCSGGTFESTSAMTLSAGGVTIDGGTSHNVVINGMGSMMSPNCFNVSSNSNVIKGLVIQNCGYGINLTGDSNVFQNNYIGTNAAGTAAVGNGEGFEIGGTADNNIIGVSDDGVGDPAAEGNVLSGNSSYGVYLNGTGNVIAGNKIGTNAAGTAAVPNGYGVYATGGTNRVGTDGDGVDDTAERNIISGNSQQGLFLYSTAQTVAGNYIGTAADGTTDLGNGSHGIFIYSGSSLIGGDIASEGNLIRYNGDGASEYGIQVDGTNVPMSRNRIYDNNSGQVAFGAATTTTPTVSGTTYGGTSGSVAISVTSTAGYSVLVYKDTDGDSNCEATDFLGEATDGNSDGVFELTGTGLSAGDKVTATAKATGVSTSQFASCDTLTADDVSIPTVEFSTASASGLESVTDVDFTIQLDQVFDEDITIDYSVDGTASGGGIDHNLAGGQATITAGLTSVDISVTITDDDIDEDDQTIIVTLTGIPTANAQGGEDTVITFTILDDDGAPTFSVSPASVSESTGTANFTVTMAGESESSASVQYATSNGTATAGTDYTAASGTLTWTAGQTGAKTFSVPISNDELDEIDETITITLSNPSGGTIGTGSATLTINDNDATPTVSVTDESIDEDAGTVTVTITQTGMSASTTSVQYATSDATTIAGTDYTAASGTVTWNPGETGDKTFVITLIDDGADEEDENITVTLSNASHVTIGDGSAEITIEDDDATPTLSITGASVSEDGSTATVTVTMEGLSDLDVTVDYETLNGTAMEGADYTASSGTLTWTGGSHGDQTFDVSILDDADHESTESFTILLSNAVHADIETDDVTVTITDDDEEEETFTVSMNLPSEVTLSLGQSLLVSPTVTTSGDEDDLIYAWLKTTDSGSESVGTGATLALLTDTAGDFTVTLTVEDGEGNTDSDEVLVHVAETESEAQVLEESVVGGSGGSSVVETRREGDNRVVLVVDNAQIILPEENSEDYVFTITSSGRFIIGLPRSGGRVYISRTDVSEMDGETDLDNAVTASESAPLSALTAMTGDSFISLMGSGEELLGQFLESGDLDGDGTDEILVGAPGYGDHGRLYVYDADLTLIRTYTGSANHPISSVIVGDFFEGGGDDLFFGPDNAALNDSLRRQAALDGSTLSGMGYFVDGGSTDTSPAVDLDLSGEEIQSAAGGDLNGDGHDDMAVMTAASAYLFFGPFTEGSDESAGTADVVLSHGDSFAGFGRMAQIGEVSGDGLPDLVIGAPGDDEDALGLVLVVLGREVWPTSLSLDDGSGILALEGSAASDAIGSDLWLMDSDENGASEIYTVLGSSFIYQIALTRESGAAASNAGGGSGGGCSLVLVSDRMSTALALVLLFANLSFFLAVRKKY